VRVGAHRARQLADGDRLARPAHAGDVALDLRVPERQLQPEGRRLGVHAVRPPDHRGVPVLFGARADGRGERLEVLQDEVARLAHLEGERRVDDVRGGQPEVQPPPRLAHALGHRRRERNHVVLCRLLERLDAGDVERGLLADRPRRLRRDDADFGHRLGRGDFYGEPGLVAPLVAPDGPHVRVRIAGDHAVSPG